MSRLTRITSRFRALSTNTVPPSAAMAPQNGQRRTSALETKTVGATEFTATMSR